MMVLHAAVVAGLLAFAESQASDMANPKKFFSNFISSPSKSKKPVSRTVRNGIFDGVKGAFTQDTPILDEDRVTPFDRWMGIDVVGQEKDMGDSFAVPDNFVDSMDEANYIVVDIPKPMGIVFEENDPKVGGVFVASLTEDGAASADATLKPGDQLVAIANANYKGADFDTCVGAIGKATEDKIRLVFFRGPKDSLYGNLGASDEWMNEFIAKGKEAPPAAAKAPAAETPDLAVASASKNIVDGYDRFITPMFNRAKYSTHRTDKQEEEKDVQLLATGNNTPITLSAIGVGLLALVTMLGVGLRKALQPATMSTSMASGLVDNISEMESQGSSINALAA
jgi:hypothetical protein